MLTKFFYNSEALAKASESLGYIKDDIENLHILLKTPEIERDEIIFMIKSIRSSMTTINDCLMRCTKKRKDDTVL